MASCSTGATQVTSADEAIGVDSGMIAVIDEALCDDYLEHVLPWYDGTNLIDLDGHFAHDGALLDTGGDGIFPAEFEICDLHVHTCTLDVEDATSMARWSRLGTIPTPSGHVLIGDPGLLEHFAPYPAFEPVDVRGVWTLLTVPNTHVTIEVLREPDGFRNLAFRLTAT